MIVSCLYVHFFSFFLLTCSLHASNVDASADDPIGHTTPAQPVTSVEGNAREESRSPISRSSQNVENSAQTWTERSLQKFSSASSGIITGVTTVYDTIRQGHARLVAAKNQAEAGVDLYTAATSVVNYATQPSEQIHPVAANFIKGCFQEIAPALENLFINAFQIGGAELAGKLAEDCGLIERITDTTVGLVIPINPLDSPYIKFLSAIISGIDMTALAGKSTTGLAPALKSSTESWLEKSVQDLSKKFNSENVVLSSSNVVIANITKTSGALFLNNTIDKTLKSLLEDLTKKFGSNSEPVIKILLFGATDVTQQTISTVSTMSARLSPVRQTINQLRPKKFIVQVANTLATKLVPASLRASWNKSLKEINKNTGTALGSILNTAITEDCFKGLQLSKIQLFNDDDLKISLNNNPDIDGWIGWSGSILETFLGALLQEGGKYAAQTMQTMLEARIAPILIEYNIPYDAKTIMSQRLQSSVASKVGAVLVRGLVYGGYYGYQALSVATDQDFWKFATEALHPQLAGINQVE